MIRSPALPRSTSNSGQGDLLRLSAWGFGKTENNPGMLGLSPLGSPCLWTLRPVDLRKPSQRRCFGLAAPLFLEKRSQIAKSTTFAQKSVFLELFTRIVRNQAAYLCL